MPSTGRGIVAWTISTLIVVAVGVAILSRIPVIWQYVQKA